MIAGTADAAGLVAGVFARAFAPRERIDAAQWAERYRFVETGATPGPWDFDRTPYLRGLTRAYSDPLIRQLSIIKAEQVGGTEGLFNCLFYAIDQRPGDKLYIYPNQDVARQVNKERLLPSMRACPRIAGKMGAERGDQGNLTQRFVDGSVCRFAGSNSDANVEVFSARDVLIDELDRCDPGIVGKTRGRRTAYPDAKLIVNGTSTDEGVGIDAEYARSDRCRWWTPCPDCGGWHVRDDFSRVSWPQEEGKPFNTAPDEVERQAWYACPDCGHPINPHEHRRTSVLGLWLPSGWTPVPADTVSGDEPAVRPGDDGPGARALLHTWVRAGLRDPRPVPVAAVWTGDPDAEHGGDTPPPPSSHAGLHIWGMMSTIVRNAFGNVAREFVESRGNPDSEWVNRRLGRAHRRKGSRVDVAELRRLCTAVAQGGYRMGECPRGTLVLTLAVDVQADRAYCEVRGWGEGGRDTSLVWCEEVPVNADAGQLGAIRDVAAMRFPMRDNPELSLPIGATAVDSGHFSGDVYDLCDRMRGEGFPNVFAIKGDGATSVLVPTRQVVIGEVTGIERHKRNPNPLLEFKVNYWKGVVLGRIRGEEVIADSMGPALAAAMADEDGPGRFLLPEDAPDEYLMQLTSEERVLKPVKGQSVHVFVVRPGFTNRNHFWDCLVYNEGLASRLDVAALTESAVERMRAKRAETPRKSSPTSRRPGLLGRSGRGMLDRGRGN